MFKECLKYNIVPFIIEDNLKMFYYRGLKEWDNEKGYLRDTCLTAQDRYKKLLDYFEIKYENWLNNHFNWNKLIWEAGIPASFLLQKNKIVRSV